MFVGRVLHPRRRTGSPTPSKFPRYNCSFLACVFIFQSGRQLKLQSVHRMPYTLNIVIRSFSIVILRPDFSLQVPDWLRTHLWCAHEYEAVRSLEPDFLQRAVVCGRSASDTKPHQLLPLGQHVRPLVQHLLRRPLRRRASRSANPDSFA